MILDILILLSWLSVTALVLLLLSLELQLGRAPRLPAPDQADWRTTVRSLRVVVPVYNEELNITGCLSALFSALPEDLPVEVVVANDGSTDATASLAELQCQRLAGASAHGRVLSVGPRPADERWCGKNWPATVASSQPWPDGDPSGQWLLFLDADVTLLPGSVAAALAEATLSSADLLSLAPRLECGCLAEWLVQPIVAALLGLGFPIRSSNDPADATAFAAGPFMLFRRSAYEAVGGHRAVAGEVVEDLALARLIKGSGLKLRYLLGVDWVNLRMYRSFAALWEGWTKNWFLGLDRSVIKAAGSVGVVLLLFAIPWVAALSAGLAWALSLDQAASLTMAALAGVALVFAVRLWSTWRFATPLKYWWLSWLGAALIAAIVPASVWKTMTGRGWTWRGRSLA
ncbi:glycosyltransferase [Vulcanococcus sp.]|uniref:glycosyltransferase n=1 Tax=Vulcanococcus sp. TaxID=2856995 RepID=UPI003230A0A1